jgi:hypothetical protein
MPIEPMRRWNMEPWVGGTAGDAEAAHHALETLALRDANDIDELVFGESRDGDDVANLER